MPPAAGSLKWIRSDRDRFGPRSERTARPLDQMELQLEELETAATEDELAAEPLPPRPPSTATPLRHAEQPGRPCRHHWSPSCIGGSASNEASWRAETTSPAPSTTYESAGRRPWVATARAGCNNSSMTSAVAQAAAAAARAHDLATVLADIGPHRPLRDIAAELTSRGVPTPRGGQWHAATVARLLDRIPAKLSWHRGDALTMLRMLPSDRYDCCVTSPPYYHLRDYYGHPDQIGLERDPRDYVARLVGVFREVRRVLKPSGTLWLNLGDSYCTRRAIRQDGKRSVSRGAVMASWKSSREAGLTISGAQFRAQKIKEKDLFFHPHALAMALRDDGWYVRAEIVWHKPIAVPEPERDRPSVAHEFVFLLCRSENYTYNAEALRENGSAGRPRPGRTVWTIAPDTRNRSAHTATMPAELAAKCIMAGSDRGAWVLDPFAGTGTTGVVAQRLGRNSDLIDLMPLSGVGGAVS
jgi:site-specific DNA-methyltransferase (cytosine-N4-specific)